MNLNQWAKGNDLVAIFTNSRGFSYGQSGENLTWALADTNPLGRENLMLINGPPSEIMRCGVVYRHKLLFANGEIVYVCVSCNTINNGLEAPEEFYKFLAKMAPIVEEAVTTPEVVAPEIDWFAVEEPLFILKDAKAFLESKGIDSRNPINNTLCEWLEEYAKLKNMDDPFSEENVRHLL